MTRVAEHTLVRTLDSAGATYAAVPARRLAVGDDLVVVKVFGRRVNAGEFERAVEELRRIAAVRSPFLLAPLEAARVDDTLVVVRPFAPFGSMAAPQRPCSTEDVLRAMASAARGAHELHESGIVHGAITPSNVLLREHGAVLADPSLSLVLDPGRTVPPGRRIAALELVDPAHVLGAPPSRATDVWALGATLHRLLTGRALLGMVPDLDPVAAVRHVVRARPTLAGPLSPGAARLVLDCVAEDPHDRPGTAEAVAERLDGLVERSVA